VIEKASPDQPTVHAPTREKPRARIGDTKPMPSGDFANLTSELAGAAKATSSGFQLLGSLRRWLSARKERATAVRQAKKLLGVADPDLFSYRVAANHPLYTRGDPHPDDRAAFASVAEDDLFQALEQKTLSLVSDVSISLSDGLVLIGSPEAEAVTRLAFGYQAKRDGNGMMYLGAPVDLPYRWEEDPERIDALSSRFVAGRGLVERPNWPIVDQRSSRDKALYPVVRNDGLLATDLLLITRVPNFLSDVAYQSGRSIISFAGTHGTATRAVEKVLHDEQLLRRIAAEIPVGTEAFQILIEVGDIYHDSALGSRARSLVLRDVQCFSRSEAAWRTATQVVAERQSAWLAQVTAE
jgi:hypothetical protein